MTDEELDDLVESHVLGEASPRQQAELQAALCADAAARRRLVERALLEVHLRRVFAADKAADVPAPRPRRIGRPASLKWLAAAAALLLACGAGLVWYAARTPDEARARRDYEVLAGAILVGGGPAAAVTDGGVVSPAGAAGATVRTPDGSRVVLSAAAEAVFRSNLADLRQLVVLRRGGARFTVPAGRGDFRVDTSVGSVTVLGTDFTVTLGNGEERSMAVAVTAGKVRVDVAERTFELAAGDSRVFAPPAARRPGSLRGTLARIDGNRLTIAVKREGRVAAEETVTVDEASEIRIERLVGLSDVTPGQHVSIRHPRRRGVFGKVIRVDGGAVILAVARGEGRRSEEVRVAVDAATEIVSDRPGGVADLSPGQEVALRHEGGRVTRLEVPRPAPPRRREGDER